MNATPYLEPEITSGFLDNATDESSGLFLVYRRNRDDQKCSGFRLILAPSLHAVFRYTRGKPRGIALTVRLIHLRFPGQLGATERYFGCKLEVVR